jgi:hypothetical protein
VRIDATPNNSRCSLKELCFCGWTNDSPAPADRRRLPVNKDMVGTKEFSPYTGAKMLLYMVVGVGGADVIQSETRLLLMCTHMRPPRDIRMMIRNILNVNGVFYSK